MAIAIGFFASLGQPGADALVCADTAAMVTGLTAAYRSGQTFITWSERGDLEGERYRVYRATWPITAETLAGAELLYEVPEDSAYFYADRYKSGDVWKSRYLDRYVIEDGGNRLAEGTGLLVWTLAAEDFDGATEGDGYYAVTVVGSDGAEDASVFDAGNSIGPVAEAVADPEPVEVYVGSFKSAHVYIQYLDLRHWNPTFSAPNAVNEYFGMNPESASVARAVQYAYTYVLAGPTAAECGGALPETLPLLLYLHPWGDGSYGTSVTGSDYCAYELRPVDVGESWWFGFARDFDYRQEGEPEAGDAIVNYTEQRVLRMVYDTLRDADLVIPVDANRVYVYGHSMGGGGALAMAERYPDLFAAAYASEPMADFRNAGGWLGHVTSIWGAVAASLPVELGAPAGWGTYIGGHSGESVWDWQNLVAGVSGDGTREVAPLGLGVGIYDTTVAYESQGAPLIEALKGSGRAWAATLSLTGHSWQGFSGMPLTLGRDELGVPFAGLQVVLRETVPGLGYAAADVLPEGIQGESYGQTIEWAASWSDWGEPPLDTAEVWQMSFRTSDGTQQTIDVTPRRLQAFVVEAGAPYDWEVRPLGEGGATIDGSVLQSGAVTASAAGLLTVPGVTVPAEGCRLVVWPAAGDVPPAVAAAVGAATASAVSPVVIATAGYSVSPDSEWSSPVSAFVTEADELIDGPLVLADRQGLAHLLWIGYTDDGSVDAPGDLKSQYVYYSSLSEGVWSEPMEIAGPASAFAAVAAPDGSLHLLVSGTGNELLHLRASATEASSARAWRVTSSIKGVTLGAGMATDDTGTLHVVFPSESPVGLYYTRSQDEGVTWSAPNGIVDLMGSGRVATYAHVAAGQSGSLHAVWTETDSRKSYYAMGVFYARSDDGGRTWSAPVELAGVGYTQANVAASAQSVHIAWNGVAAVGGRYYQSSDNDGRTWSTVTELVPAGVGGTEGEPQLAVASDGSVHVLFAADSRMLYTSRTDGDWSNPEAITALVGPTVDYSEEPAMAIGLGNQVHAAFWDDRVRLWYTGRMLNAPAMATVVPQAPTKTPSQTVAVTAPATSIPTTTPALANSVPVPGEARDGVAIMIGGAAVTLLMGAAVLGLVVSRRHGGA